MIINNPDSEILKSFFKKIHDAPSPLERAYAEVELRNYFHGYYMEKIEIILAIAGEMQKHFRDTK